MKTPTISARAKSISESPIRKLLPFLSAAKEKGLEVFQVHIGDPDLKTPRFLINALRDATENIKKIPYTNARGLSSTIKSWQKYYERNGINLVHDDIIITSGASEALLIAGELIFNPGDKYLVFEPFYGIYQTLEHLINAEPIGVPLNKNTGYHLPEKNAIIKNITPKVKAILFNNPNNPAGTVYTKAEIRTIIEVAQEYGLFIISDETYQGIVFDNKKSISILEVATEKEKQNIIVIDSVSKRYSACGLRMGVLISRNKELITHALRIAQTRISAPYVDQKALSATFDESNEYSLWLNKKYQERRDIFIETVEKHLSINVPSPEGAIYIMLSLPIKNSEHFAIWLLTHFSNNNETVMVTPGEGFYVTPGLGKNEIRIALVRDKKILKRVAELICLGLTEYKKAGFK